MNKIIINYKNVDEKDAVSHVEYVIGCGKLSKNFTQYSDATLFKNDLVVLAKLTKSGNHSFKVYKR